MLRADTNEIYLRVFLADWDATIVFSLFVLTVCVTNAHDQSVKFIDKTRNYLMKHVKMVSNVEMHELKIKSPNDFEVPTILCNCQN